MDKLHIEGPDETYTEERVCGALVPYIPVHLVRQSMQRMRRHREAGEGLHLDYVGMEELLTTADAEFVCYFLNEVTVEVWHEREGTYETWTCPVCGTYHSNREAPVAR